MIATITHSEIREGAKGNYLYIKYVTDKGKEGGKAVFQELKDKWKFCEKNATVELKLDEKYNIVEIRPVAQAIQEAGKMPQEKPPEKAVSPDGEKSNLVKEATKIDKKMPEYDEQRNRSMALSYSKDLAAAGKIDLSAMRKYADEFVKYIKGE